MASNMKFLLVSFLLVMNLSFSFRVQQCRSRRQTTKLRAYGEEENKGIPLKALGAGALIIFGVFGSDIFGQLARTTAQSAKQLQVASSSSSSSATPEANNLKGADNVGSMTRLNRREINAKLSQIPIFFATDSATGGIYTSNGIANLFVEKNDADKLARSIGLQVSVSATTLDDVYYTLIEKKTKLTLVDGVVGKSEPSAKYLLQPSSSQFQQTTPSFQASHPNDIPLFRVTNLAFEKPNGLEVPLFLRREDALSAYERLQSAKTNSPDMKSPDVQVTSLLDLVKLFNTGGFEGRSLEVYPSMDAIEEARKLISGT